MPTKNDSIDFSRELPALTDFLDENSEATDSCCNVESDIHVKY